MAKRLNKAEEELLKNKAHEAFLKAVCPFSHFGVGCAILLNDGKIVQGFNIESSAYSATICAERVTLVSAISQYGVKKEHIKAIGIYLESDKIGSPCGVCRQFLFEYCPSDTPLYMFNGKGPEIMSTVGELLPYGFGKDNLKK